MKHAYDVLHDAERRARYDAGEIDSDDECDVDAPVEAFEVIFEPRDGSVLSLQRASRVRFLSLWRRSGSSTVTTSCSELKALAVRSFPLGELSVFFQRLRDPRLQCAVPLDSLLLVCIAEARERGAKR
jgi:hypothetical protein